MNPTVVPTAVSVVDHLTPNQVIAFLAVIAFLVVLRMVWRAWLVFLRGEPRPPKRSQHRKRRKRRKAQPQAQAKEQLREPRL